MKLTVVIGAPGSGKSYTAFPFLAGLVGGKVITTGHYAKYLWLTARGFCLMPGDSETDDWYDIVVTKTPSLQKNFIEFIEGVRKIHPEFSAWSLQYVAKQIGCENVVTEAISPQEFAHLSDFYSISSVVLLDCAHPRPKSQYNNKPIPTLEQIGEVTKAPIYKISYEHPEDLLDELTKIFRQVD